MSYLPDLLTSLANVAGQVQTAINVAIAKLPDGTTTFLSTTGPTAGAISVIGSAAIPALPGPMTSADTFPVIRAGNTYAATTAQAAAGLGSGSAATAFEGLDQQPAAAAVSDTDAIPVAQPSQVGGALGTLVRGTAAQLWAYTASKLPSYRIPVVELSANTTLDGPAHNRRILVCTTSLTLAVPATFGNLTTAGVAFETELQIENGATLTLPTTGAAITGPATIVGPAQARVRAWITSGAINRLSCSVPTGGAGSTGTGTSPTPTPTPTPTPSGAPALTLTNATFGAGGAGFGQALTGGTGSAALTMASGARTYEFFYQSATSPGTDTLLLGMPAYPDGIYAGVSGTIKAFGPGPSVLSGTVAVANGARHHVALVDDGLGANASLKMFIDGVSDGSGSSLAHDANPTLNIGGFGTIDEVRISKIARYTAAFTPPTGPFVSDANTVALYHLDGNGASS